MDGRKLNFDTTQVLVMVLAGGEGKRLYPLTLDRAKPAVPFGGRYRIIDIVLSNFVNSGLRQIKVLTQYKSASLEEHIARAWHLHDARGTVAIKRYVSVGQVMHDEDVVLAGERHDAFDRIGAAHRIDAATEDPDR